MRRLDLNEINRPEDLELRALLRNGRNSLARFFVDHLLRVGKEKEK